MQGPDLGLLVGLLVAVSALAKEAAWGRLCRGYP
jgi:hypothetical protein